MRTGSTTAQMGRINLESLNKPPLFKVGNWLWKAFHDQWAGAITRMDGLKERCSDREIEEQL